MDRQLLEYLPPVLQQVREMQEINNAQQPEIKEAWDAIDSVLDNQFLETATDSGLKVWESELGIVAAASDTLETRKERIHTLWVFGIAYTFLWLKDWLSSSYMENASAALNDYTISLRLKSTIDYETLLTTLRNSISAAIVIKPTILLKEANTTYFAGAAFRHSIVQTMQTPAWDTSFFCLLTDELGQVLIDGTKSVFYEEVQV